MNDNIQRSLGFLAILGLSGCAYMNSGATQNVLINAPSRDSVFVNDHYLGQGQTSVLLLKKNEYILNIKSDSNGSIFEPIRSQFNFGYALLDYPVFEYGYPVDISTGSFRNMVDGANYKVLGERKNGGELDVLNRGEAQEKQTFLTSIGMTFFFLTIGGGVSQLTEFHNPPTAEASIEVLTAALFGGMVYEIYRTVKSVKSINRINQQKEYK